MDTIVLDTIPFRVDMPALMQRLRVQEGNCALLELQALVAEAEALARPKALYGPAYIDAKGDEHVVVDGVKFTSRVLRVNLEHAYRVFPFVASCGMELHTWGEAISDMLLNYWAQAIKEQALRAATKALNEHLLRHFSPGKLATMNPGSLPSWPLKEQRPLFALLGNPQERIGVQLTESMLMVPNKSVSGLRFPTEESYENCQLCPRPSCPGRRADYDSSLYERKYTAQDDPTTP
jgi:hypothetical protein